MSSAQPPRQHQAGMQMLVAEVPRPYTTVVRPERYEQGTDSALPSDIFCLIINNIDFHIDNDFKKCKFGEVLCDLNCNPS